VGSDSQLKFALQKGRQIDVGIPAILPNAT